MDLVQLRYAVKVAETENFSRAAEQCFVTQPTLSQRIHQLEQELGVPLFERSTRRVSLTDAGRLFVAKAQIILADADRLAEEMEGERRRIKGSLSIGVLTTLSHLNIPQYLSSFQQQYPNIAVELELGWS
ncbi:MAG: LysR family transcriptional regulator, partial [Pseudoflavonifractor sp.]